ncbi:hypothetical protein GJV85_07305 [Sulfurimonas aquatica]|uniref:Uncharacterized protein n=1 Tax=Sulfurimonas aquatica TaxID=2672570 RepID=A0A975GD42_9BACT|nr:hypothetical protein [Sulfurimonas aquatica]QSZ41919.1 hypothetical protein GJV85_07305 [Sulfurimonas aquatica]
MKTNNTKTEVQNKKLKNYQEFVETIKRTPEDERQLGIKAAAKYIEYIKLHDKEAYKNYLSYSTYLKTCI